MAQTSTLELIVSFFIALILAIGIGSKFLETLPLESNLVFIGGSVAVIVVILIAVYARFLGP